MNAKKIKSEKGAGKYIEGTIRVTAKGIGYVSPDDEDGNQTKNRDDSIEIDSLDLNTVLARDRVWVLLHSNRVGGHKTAK